MKPQNGLDSFWPYDSIDEIYQEKTLPEFGRVPSKWQFFLPLWRFIHAENRDMVPLDFALPTCDDSLWDAVELPSVWQQEGYGIPANLMYDAGSKAEESTLKARIQAKFASLANSEIDDDVGVYRTWIVTPASFSDRAVYFICSGIRGRYELYLNGRLVTSSGACYTAQKILLSPFFEGDHNLLTILVYRLNSDRRGRVRRENGTFGMSGIFRMPEIVAESVVEISGLHITPAWIESAPLPVNLSELSDTPDKTEAVSPETDDIVTETAVTDPAGRRDGCLRIQLSLSNHADQLMPVHVTAEMIEVRPEYDLYHLPVHPASASQSMQCILSPGADAALSTELQAASVLPWTDRTPNLYDLVLTVRNDREKVICVKRLRFGFRTAEVIARVFHINDTAIPLRVVRYFDFDPAGGLAVPEDRLRQDICLMKQANLNTVLVAHYPSDPLFYQMCDQYGLYVISQADAGLMRDMFESLMTHPSIIMWSFAPLHFDEGKLWELKQKLLILDGSRPFYCERDRSLVLSDIPPFPCEAGTFLGEWSDICIDRRVLQTKFEPGHSVFDYQQGRARRESDTADFRWLHQGDLEEYHEKMDVPIAQGIVSADRIPHPMFYEIMKQCGTLQCIASPENPADLFLHNLHPIGETYDLTLYWQLLLGGMRIRGGHGLVRSIPPLGRQEIRFPFTVSEYMEPDWMLSDPLIGEIYDKAQSHELVLDIRACLAEDIPYAPRGYETAFYQQVLTDAVAGRTEKSSEDFGNLPSIPFVNELTGTSSTEAACGKLAVSTRPEALQVSRDAVKISFSRSSGGLKSMLLGDREMLSGSVQPSFYRAATNSDRSDQSFVLAATVFSKETDWRTIQHDLRYQKFHYEMTGEDFCMLVHYKSFAFKGDVLVQYIMSPDGKLKVTLAFTPRYDMQRSGFRVNIPNLMNKICWYGRGFHEAYPDRKESARIGYFEAEPRDLYYEYARPQENGSHCDTDYLLILDESGKGMKITSAGGEKFSFSASPYSPEDIDDHQHQEELQTGDSYELFLDFYQKGIERTGHETHPFIRNQTCRGSFIFEPWEPAVQSAPSDPEFP